MSAVHRTIGRLAAAGAALSLAVAVVLGVAAPSGAQTADGQVTSDKEGWWNRVRGAEEEAFPDNPLGGTAPVPPPPTSVPPGAIAVGAVLGETDKVAAVGIVLPIEQGGTVERLVMTLALAEGDGAQSGDAPTGAIRACPVTGFFVPEENGEFQNRPDADCELASAPGTRNEDGSFTFDLTSIAALWVDPAGTVFPNGVLLEPVVEPPSSFQISFAGAPDGIVFDFAGTAGEGSTDPFDLGGGDAGGFGDATGGGSFGGSSGGISGGTAGGSFDTGGGGGGFTAPDAVVPPAEPSDPAAAAPPAAEDEVALAPAPVSQVGNTLGNLPAGAWLALLLGLGLALVAAITLGPAGMAEAAPRRAGGVSRALAQRTAPVTTTRLAPETSR